MEAQNLGVHIVDSEKQNKVGEYNKETNPYDVKIRAVVDLFKGDDLGFAEDVLKQARKRLKTKAVIA